MSEDDMSGYTVLRQIDKWSTTNLDIHQWRLSEVKKGNDILMMKEFHPLVSKYLEEEVSILQAIKNGPYTVQICGKKTITQSPNGDYRSYILFKGGFKGNMKDYLLRYFRIDQHISKILIKQILLCLNHAYNKKIIHKRLRLKDIFMTRQDIIQVGGWQETLPHNQQSLKQLMFSCGELIITMLTMHPPFNNYTNTDCHYKFISDKYIHKFWQSISRKFPNKNVSEDLKLLVTNLFLNKISSIQEIMNDYIWLKTQLTSHLEIQQIHNYFHKKQTEYQLNKSKSLQQKKQFKQKVEAVKEQFQVSNRGDNGGQNIENQYQIIKFLINQKQFNINQKYLQKTTTQGYLVIHEKIDFVLAYIKYLFTQCIKDKKNIIPDQDEEYLDSEKFVLKNNEILISLSFKTKSEEISYYDLKMKFFKTENKEIATQIEIEKQKENYISQSLIYYIKNQIEQLNQNVCINKNQNK